jgi:OPA family glycerol-3-phosphate transporter-like MFS transporter
LGLPPIEEYRGDYPAGTDSKDLERELTFRELFVDKVLRNRLVWLLAGANFFAYVTRYSMLDWGPTYLREVKGASVGDGGLAILALEFGGIPSTILFGWLSDRVGGRRGMVAASCMVPIFVAFAAILFTPPGLLWLDMTMLVIVGFFIYPVINLIVIAALDIASKKAIGTAAGFIGLFGYVGRTVQAKGFGATVDHVGSTHDVTTAWSVVLCSILGCAAMATFLLALTWRVRPRA